MIKDGIGGGNTITGLVFETKTDEELLESAEKMTVPETQIVDKFMTYYLPIVLVVAVLMWLFTKDISKAIAILVKEIKEISPLRSKRFTEPKLTPDFSLNLSCDNFLRLRIRRILSAIFLLIS